MVEAKSLTFELSEIDGAAKEFLNLCKNHFFFAFYGTLGAGKTTFIKSVCKVLGCEDNVVSPTYSLVNEYLTQSPDYDRTFTIYHMDFYRLENIEQAVDIGVEEYFNYKNSFCFIEWPELVEDILPENTVKVFMEPTVQGKRTLRIEN